MNTHPYWSQALDLPRYPTLAGDVSVDLAIVGGGITGITAAFLAKRAGLTVALLERDRLAQVDTGHTTAHLTAVTDLRLQEIQHTFGDEVAARVWEAGLNAIGRIEHIVRNEDIACDFRRVPGFLHAAAPEDAEELQREAEAATKLGIAAKFVTATPFFATPGVRFENQALFHPLAYLGALAQRIPGEGSHVFENSAAEEITAESIRTAGGRLQFRHVFVATHNPLAGDLGILRATLLQTKLALYTSYVIGARVPLGRIPEGSYWDTAEPYRYLRVDPRASHDHIIYGGEDHKTGQESDTTAPYARLEEHLRRLVPEAEIDSRWSGQVIETNDGLPFIGEVTDRQYIATGFAGNGMTFGTLAAQMLVWDLTGVDNPWKKLFDPHRRKFLGGTWDYLKENKDFPYYLVRDWLARPEAASLNDIQPGEGRTVIVDKKKVAAYRDPEGHLSLCSAVCTHLKCIVNWNSAEKTWDCPCHGSRFQPDGSVISGPAEEPLRRLDAAASEAAR